MKEPAQVNEKYAAQIDAMYEQFKRGKSFYAKEWIERLTRPDPENKLRICIWGAGQFGHDLYNRFLRLCGVNVSAFCDSDPQKWGRMLWGSIPVVSPGELKPDCRVVVAVSGHEEEIRRACLAHGVARENIFLATPSPMTWYANCRCAADEAFCGEMVRRAKEVLGYFGSDRRSKEVLVEMMARRLLGTEQPASQDGVQYFIPELPLRPDEAFVDAGAFDGDTLREFARRIPGKGAGAVYYAFECGGKNYEALQRNLKDMHCGFPVELYPLALWDKTEQLHFSAGGTSGEVDAAGEETVMAGRLDGILAGKRVTWIKMDIEGAEMQALAGCAEIIKRQKPRLAICVYHKANDFYEIPRYIKSLRSDYQMLLRHHSALEFETVLYAY